MKGITTVRHVLWAGLALMTALGLQSPSANAQLTRSYNAASYNPIIAPASTTGYESVAVNRNPSSPHKNRVYVAETTKYKQVRIYDYDPAQQKWTDTGLSVTPASGIPRDIAIGADDSIWFIDSVGKAVQSAPHPSAATPNTTATVRTPALATGTYIPLSIAVSGTLNNASVYVTTSEQKLIGYSMSAPGIGTPLFTVNSGYNIYGVTIDATGAVCVPISGAQWIRRYNPTTGALATPSVIANKPAWAANSTLFDLDFVHDDAYPGDGYFVYSSRFNAAAPYKLVVYRFDGTGSYLDGFGPAQANAVNYSVVDIDYPSAFSGAHLAPDTDGNIFARYAVGANGGLIRIGVINDPNPTDNPWGDVNGDGKVTEADAQMVEAYLANPNAFTAAQRDRIKRYGDINGTQNHNAIGNGVVNSQDSMRMLLMAGGIIDPGTAGPAPAGYGDINGDGVVDLLDAVATQRGANGLGDAATLTVVNTRGRGDISPTVPSISFGDKAITQDDANAIRARAFGTEANPPAYIDHWPLRAPFDIYTSLNADTYTFTDVTGRSGDLMHQVTYQTQAPKEINGFTITEMKGTDGSLIGVYKATDGSVYAKYLKYPYAFGNRLLTFDAPMKILDNSAMTNPGATWSGETSTSPADLGYRPVTYKGTLLANEDVYTPAAGNFTAAGDAPKSTWSKTARIRLDVALLAGPESSIEMQQAFFYDLMPFIGMVNRGQAALRGSAAPTTDRPLLRLDEVRARGVTYSPTAP